MVFGVKFPWKRLAAELLKRRFKFDPFADDEGVISPRIERMLDCLELDNPPTPAKLIELVPARYWEPGLEHPRPRRAVALKNALTRFEEIAQSSDASSNGGSQISPPISETDSEEYGIRLVTKPRECESGFYSPLPFENDGVFQSAMQSSQQASTSPSVDQYVSSFMERSLAKARAIGNICFYPPTPAPTHPAPKADSLRPYGGLACLSPGFLDHFPGHARQGQPPRPTFVLQRPPNYGTTPVVNPGQDQTVPPGNMDGPCADAGVQKEVDAAENKGSKDIDNDELEYVSDSSEDEDEDEDGCEPKIVFNFDNEDSYYTASDISIYDDEDGYNGDVEDSDEPESPCESPRPESLLSPISSAGSLSSNASTSSLPSTLSTESGQSQWIGPIPSFPLIDAKLPDAWDTSLCDEIEAFINGDD